MGNDTIYGADDKDSLFGDSGTDFISGGAGKDLIDGGTGNDLLDGDGEIALIVSDSSSPVTLPGGSDVIDGNEGNDTLLGGGNNDILSGGKGNDILQGGAGKNTLIGSEGKDIFILDNPIKNRINIITDFVVKTDKIVVSAANFGGGLTPDKVINVNQFTIGSSAQDVSDRFIYNNKTGSLFFDVDGNDESKQIMIANLSTNLNLTNNDIFVDI